MPGPRLLREIEPGPRQRLWMRSVSATAFLLHVGTARVEVCPGVLLGAITIFLALSALGAQPTNATPPRLAAGYAGSSSCRECHAHFYELWAPSHHGLAMQPYT